MALGSSVGLVAILVIGKTIGDLFFHTKEHKGAGGEVNPGDGMT